MAAPVIIATQSVLEFTQWAPFEFQPYGTNSPTAWNSSPLPPGVIFDPFTGKITGPATMPGVYDIALTAINGDGASTPVTFTLGIEASSALPPVDAVDITVDLGTGEVSVAYPSARKVQRGGVDVVPLFWFKQNDIRLLHVRFVKGGVVWDQDLTSLKFSLKAFEEDPALIASSTMEREATGSATFYRMAVAVSSAALDGELGTDADDDGTGFAAIAELEWVWPAFSPVVGPILRTTSLNFLVGVAPELIPNS